MIKTPFNRSSDKITEELTLPQIRIKDNGNNFNMSALRASSPLRSDVAITAQLDAFHQWLKRYLPQNRQGRLTDIFARLEEDETTVEQIRTLLPDKDIPKSILGEIKKQVSSFCAWYKKELDQAQVLLDFKSGTACLAKFDQEDNIDDEDDEVLYQESLQDIPGQQEFNDELE